MFFWLFNLEGLKAEIVKTTTLHIGVTYGNFLDSVLTTKHGCVLAVGNHVDIVQIQIMDGKIKICVTSILL